MKNNTKLKQLIKESITEIKKEERIRSLIKEEIVKLLSEEEEVDESVFGKIGASLGAFNKDAIEKAEGKLKSGDIDTVQGKKAPADMVKSKMAEFMKYKEMYEKGDKEGTEAFKQIVKHINTNGNVLYSVKDNMVKSGARYGKEGGTGAQAGA